MSSTIVGTDLAFPSHQQQERDVHLIWPAAESTRGGTTIPHPSLLVVPLSPPCRQPSPLRWTTNAEATRKLPASACRHVRARPATCSEPRIASVTATSDRSRSGYAQHAGVLRPTTTTSQRCSALLIRAPKRGLRHQVPAPRSLPPPPAARPRHQETGPPRSLPCPKRHSDTPFGEQPGVWLAQQNRHTRGCS